MDPDARELLKQVGLTDFHEDLLDAEPPLPVDSDKVRAYLDNELVPLEKARISYLMANYKAWDNARRDLVIERAKKTHDQERIAAAMWLQWMMRKRMLMAASVAAMILVIGVFLFWGNGTNGFRDGTNRVAFHDGNVTGLQQYGNDWNDLASAALLQGSMPEVATLGRLQENLRLRRALPSQAIRSPLFTAVRSEKPDFSWRKSMEATGYEVFVYREQDLDEPIDQSGEVQGLTWNSDASLESGILYRWYVIHKTERGEVQFPQPEEYPARFLVLSAEARQRVEQAEKELTGSHLLLFLLYFREGLFDEAQMQLDQLQRDNPESKPLAVLQQQFDATRKSVFDKNSSDDGDGSE